MSEKKYKFSYVINPSACKACAQCYTECRFEAVGPDPATLTSYFIDQEVCTRCARCFRGCPVSGCIEKVANE